MANIMDYIAWRGDLSFEQSPFCEVDNLIFTQLAYIDFSDIVSESFAEDITVNDAWGRYSAHIKKPLGAILPGEIVGMFEKAAESERFGKARLSGYVNYIDEKAEKQFSAICINTGKFIFAAFRGTDDTLVGWKEDFNLAFMESVPAQLEAVKYIKNLMTVKRFMPVYIGGHSKGGNLAVYAAANCKKQYVKRIKHIYNNDGPGFRGDIINSEGYLIVKDKITTIVPEGSVVGQLLNHADNDIIIKNAQPTLLQHSAFTWEVAANKFVTVDKLNENSIMIDSVIRNFISDMSTEQRGNFVETLYEILRASDAKTLTDIMNDKAGFLKALGTVNKEKMKEFKKSIGKIAEEAMKTVLNKKQ